MSAMMRVVRATLLVLAFATLALGCTEPEAPLPTMAAPPPADLSWPAVPSTVPAEARRCAEDYRALARDGLPPQLDGQTFSAWYRGPFQTWTDRYNDLRGRCDEVFSSLDESSVGAQVMLATQSRVHERAAEQARPFEAEPQMFVLGRYWSLGAACTYQACGRGPDRQWAALCSRQQQELPACPPVDSTPAE